MAYWALASGPRLVGPHLCCGPRKAQHAATYDGGGLVSVSLSLSLDRSVACPQAKPPSSSSPAAARARARERESSRSPATRGRRRLRGKPRRPAPDASHPRPSPQRYVTVADLRHPRSASRGGRTSPVETRFSSSGRRPLRRVPGGSPRRAGSFACLLQDRGTLFAGLCYIVVLIVALLVVVHGLVPINIPYVS